MTHARPGQYRGGFIKISAIPYEVDKVQMLFEAAKATGVWLWDRDKLAQMVRDAKGAAEK